MSGFTIEAGPRHTSILYFHGMGTPKRYEELTRVLDSLDRFAEAANDDLRIGRLREQIVKLEPSRAGVDEPVAYIAFSRLLEVPNKGKRRVGLFRLYESYWSPQAAGGVSPLSVLLWVIGRIRNPFAVLLRPWRAHQRLALTFLYRLAFDRRKIPVARFQRLMTSYRSFEGMDQRRLHPAGWFHEFLRSVTAATDDKAEAAQLAADARAWRRSLIAAQLQVLVVAVFVAALLFGVATLAIAVLVALFQIIGLPLAYASGLEARNAILPGWILLGAAIGLPLGAVGVSAFFRNFLSDVVFWTTIFEKDVRYQKRRDILKACEATLIHALSDPQCERVVIVAHSLGTAIAYETLLNLGRRSRAQENRDALANGLRLEPLFSKLSHFVTFGSPIDRIAYFFSLQYSRYHRFNRVVDDLRGTVSDSPFRVQKARTLQWINIRDAADPVASRLFSPRGRLPNREEIIEIEASSSHAPDPAAAHGSYFDGALGARVLFDSCILDRKQVQAHHGRSKLSLGYTTWARRLFWAMTALALLCLTAGAVGYWTMSPALAVISQGLCGAALIVIVLLMVSGKIFDRISSLKLPA
ncbi:MAG: hypothetical protein ACI8U3_001291 [Brevundimonas sp.]|uniref:hypothetical protein n=1 Tax=Brevundimonas sp. TaxID=1871086 RepID=UPI0039E62D77